MNLINSFDQNLDYKVLKEITLLLADCIHFHWGRVQLLINEALPQVASNDDGEQVGQPNRLYASSEVGDNIGRC